MNKSFLFLLIGLFLISFSVAATWGLISGGAQAEVILNSPANNEIDYDGVVIFNASANVTGGATLNNMTLYNNISGSWVANGTIIPSQYINKTESHGDPLATSPITETKRQGAAINISSNNIIIYGMVKAGSQAATTGAIGTSPNGLDIANCTFSGNDCNFTGEIILNADTTYYLSAYNGGASFNLAWNNGGWTPTNSSDNSFKWWGRVDWVPSPVFNDGMGTFTSLYISSLEATTSSTQTFNRTITGPTKWNVQACDSDGDCGFATANRTVLLDTSKPQITVQTPTGTLGYGAIGNNETLNVTFTDTNLASCWYNYNGTNVSIPGCLTGVKNSTNFLLQGGNTNMTLYANDGVGNLNSSFISWGYKLFENSQNYSSVTTVGAVENFILNVSMGSGYDISSVSLIYGNSTLSPGITSSGNNRIISVSNYEIPYYAIDTNISFYWAISLDDSSLINTSNKTQLISPVLLDNCSTYTNQILNISLFNEETKSLINGDIELEYTLLNSQTYSTINTLYYKATNINSTLVCSQNNISAEDLIYSAQIRYESTDHVSEFYNIQRSAITTTAPTVNLYDLSDNDSTTFKITYQDSTFNFVEGAIIQLQRKYISEGIYETVEAPLTSNQGVAVTHIDLNSIAYRVTVVKNGVVLDEFDNLVFKCQSELTGECEQKLLGTINPRNNQDLDTTRDFSYSINRSDNTIILSFSIPSGAPSSVNMQLIQKDQFGSSEMCNETILSSAGSISCAFNDTIGDSYIDLKIYKNGEPMAIQSYIIPEASGVDFLGNNYIIIVVLLLSVVGMALTSPEWIIINGIIVMVIAGALWLVNGLDFVMGLGSLMWLIVAAGILIFKLAKQEDR